MVRVGNVTVVNFSNWVVHYYSYIFLPLKENMRKHPHF